MVCARDDLPGNFEAERTSEIKAAPRGICLNAPQTAEVQAPHSWRAFRRETGAFGTGRHPLYKRSRLVLVVLGAERFGSRRTSPPRMERQYSTSPVRYIRKK